MWIAGLAERAGRSCFLVLFAVCYCAAQTNPATSSLRGTVLDPNHAAIAGAKVNVTTQAGAVRGSQITGATGQFSFALAPDDYTLTVVAVGFAQTSLTVNLRTQTLSSLDIVLSIAASSASVTVTDTSTYETQALSSATRTLTALRDIPQSISVITNAFITDQAMTSISDVVNYIPGITSHQGENNRDQVVIRGNNTTADFFRDGVRDDVQYYRDLYNVDRVEALKGPNAMIFGRGGAGGVINRVTKEAGVSRTREIRLQGGSFQNKRFTGDFDHSWASRIAVRLNSLYEHSGSFRRHVNLKRYGLNPTVTIAPRAATTIKLAYEHFYDKRVADRGIPSFQGKPADLPISTFFGNPNDSRVRARVNLASATIDHRSGRFTILNRTLMGKYNRRYQNYVPGAVTTDKTRVALSAYNNSTRRRNIFNQTDLTFSLKTDRVQHTFLAGAEAGSQRTDNFRNTGFFNNATTSVLVDYTNPVVSIPVTFRQSATDADNHLETNLAATYAQDQIELSRSVHVLAGLRFDYFDLKLHNNRAAQNLRRIDRLVSPRLGMVFTPIAPLSLYVSYSVSYLPSAGDQFASLTAATQQLKPEHFANYELGAKVELGGSLFLTTALYRLNRRNSRAPDPNDHTRILQTGSQRTTGYEIGLNGAVNRRWRLAGGYAYQDALITSTTTAAPAGARVAQVPHHAFSLWNGFRILKTVEAGLGVIHRSDMFAAVDNLVILPGYTRFDAAVFWALSDRWRLQANIENLLNKTYYLNADGNNNISPGRPRGMRAGLIARF